MDEEGNSGVPFFLSLAVCIRALCVIVVLPFFFPFKVKVFFLCCLSCFFNIWLLTENKEDNNRKKTKMKKKRGENIPREKTMLTTLKGRR
jgi:hypothetical protein